MIARKPSGVTVATERGASPFAAISMKPLLTSLVISGPGSLSCPARRARRQQYADILAANHGDINVVIAYIRKRIAAYGSSQ